MDQHLVALGLREHRDHLSTAAVLVDQLVVSDLLLSGTCERARRERGEIAAKHLRGAGSRDHYPHARLRAGTEVSWEERDDPTSVRLRGRMYLSGLIHRDRLFDIASRWLADRAQPTDGRQITEIFAFERMVTAPVVRRLVADLSRATGDRDLLLERVTSKDAVREAIVAAAAHPSERVAELIDWYRQLPEEFFARTPVQMSIVTRRNGKLAALIRRKRIRRISDKVCRKVARQIGGEVDRLAAALARTRPGASTNSTQHDESPGGMPRGVRGAAERLLADRIRFGRLVLDSDSQRVDDVIGIKIIGTEQELTRIDATLAKLPYASTFGREVHDGSYSGVHYLVDLELPPKGAIVDSVAGVDWSFAAGRGLLEEDMEPSFLNFVESASSTFRVEIILATFEDLAESEFGESIHEQRILEQRFRASDYGRIATNGAWIIEYLLHLAASPTVAVSGPPIKLWGRYIRDTVQYAIARLYTAENVAWPIPLGKDGQLITLD